MSRRWSRAAHSACVGAVIFACASWAAPARGAQHAQLEASFRPDRLGASTTIFFGFQIAGSYGAVPSPLTKLDLSYPESLNLATTGLGVQACSTQTLEVQGPTGCPSDSILGYGRGLAEIQFGPEILSEPGNITTFMAPLKEGRLGLVFFAKADSPVEAELIFSALVLPAPAPFGGELETNVPLIPTLPGAPNAAVVQLQTTIGPIGVTYYEHLHGRYLPYSPKGFVLPSRCPRGGFPFRADFTFLDGTSTTATSTIPCPGGRAH
jgi:hypothetical protein